MLQKLLKWLAALLMVLGSATRPGATQPPTEMDVMLEWQDRQVLARYQQSFPQDFRYQELLGRIGVRLNRHLAEVYPNPRKQVLYYVFVGHMGFNAQTWNRVIIFDTLLVDALRNLAQGIAVHKSMDAPYIQQLAQYVAHLNAACQKGVVFPNLHSRDNPYQLPTIWGLTPAQREGADSLFEEMLAGWMAHEGSHAFLDHCRDRVEEQRLVAMYQQGRIPPDVLQAHIKGYLSYSLTMQKERDADEKGIRLLVKSGYSVEGLIATLEFARMLEEISGVGNETFRTHPTPDERIRLAREIAEQERQGKPGSR